MLTHVVTTLTKPALLCSCSLRSARAQVGSCLPARRHAFRFRTFATSQESSSPGTEDVTTGSSTEGSGQTASALPQHTMPSSVRDFLKFAFERQVSTYRLAP
ncbi:hypothetical protein C8Q72DRAFT_829814 [Fomitopsis betulina]|nr:hypothetical protein C8Q72DRAFT_829814 [Fomitopsis betulina]